MSMFRKKYNYREDFLPQSDIKFRHLDRIADLNKVVLREPVMKGNGSTVVFLPYPDFDNPDPATRGVCPDRLSDDPRDYGPWLCSVEGVRYFGKNPVTLIFDNPDDAGFNAEEDHPVNLIYETVRRTVKAQQHIQTPLGSSDSDEWEALLEGKKGPPVVYGCLSRPGPLTCAYALIHISGQDNYASAGMPFGGAEGDKPVIFVMTRNTAQSLFEALDPKPDHLVTGCKAIHFYDRRAGNCPAKTNAEQVAAQNNLGGRRAPVAAAATAAREIAGYGVYVSDTVNGMPTGAPINRDVHAAHALKTVIPWDKVLRGYTPAQCAKIIADQCGLPLSLLYHAWKSRPEYYSDELKHRLTNPVSANMAPGPVSGRSTQPGFGVATGPQPGPTTVTGTDPRFNQSTHHVRAGAPAQTAPRSGFGTEPPADGGGFGVPPGTDEHTYPLGSAPWDNPAAAGGQPPDAGDGGSDYDDAAARAAEAKFREMSRARAGQGSATARSTAAQSAPPHQPPK